MDSEVVCYPALSLASQNECEIFLGGHVDPLKHLPDNCALVISGLGIFHKSHVINNNSVNDGLLSDVSFYYEVRI